MKNLTINYVTMYDTFTAKPQRLWWFIDHETGAEEAKFSTKANALACARRIRKAYREDANGG